MPTTVEGSTVFCLRSINGDIPKLKYVLLPVWLCRAFLVGPSVTNGSPSRQFRSRRARLYRLLSNCLPESTQRHVEGIWSSISDRWLQEEGTQAVTIEPFLSNRLSQFSLGLATLGMRFVRTMHCIKSGR